MIVLVGAITNPWASILFKSSTTVIILLYGKLSHGAQCTSPQPQLQQTTYHRVTLKSLQPMPIFCSKSWILFSSV